MNIQRKGVIVEDVQYIPVLGDFEVTPGNEWILEGWIKDGVRYLRWDGWQTITAKDEEG